MFILAVQPTYVAQAIYHGTRCKDPFNQMAHLPAKSWEMDFLATLVAMCIRSMHA